MQKLLPRKPEQYPAHLVLTNFVAFRHAYGRLQHLGAPFDVTLLACERSPLLGHVTHHLYCVML